MTDDYPCPACDDTFDSSRSQKLHHYHTHGERLVDTATCEVCDTTFESTSSDHGKYCSLECVGRAKRNRIALECEECGDAFSAPPCEADDRIYCSIACKNRARSDQHRRECHQCGRTFSTYPADERWFCCQACSAEHRLDRARPPRECIAMLCWLLYSYEDYNLTATYRRQRAVLGHQRCLTQAQVKALLRTLGVFDPDGQTRRTLEDLDPDDVFSPVPSGDDSWQAYSNRGAADD